MEKKRKKRVRVMGHWIQVVHVKGLLEDGERCWGVCLEDELTIVLEEDMSDILYKRTLNHEKMHMRLRLCGLIELIPPEIDEALARMMELE